MGGSIGVWVLSLLWTILRVSFFKVRLLKIGHGSLRSLVSSSPLSSFGEFLYLCLWLLLEEAWAHHLHCDVVLGIAPFISGLPLSGVWQS